MVINDLKALLYVEVAKLEENVSNFNLRKYQKINDIINFLNNTSYQELYNNIDAIINDMREVLEEVKVKVIGAKLYSCVNKLKDYNTTDDYNLDISSLVAIKNILYNEMYINSLTNIEDIKKKIIAYRKIISSLKFGIPLSDYLLKYLKNFLSESEVLEGKQVEILERIKIFNDHTGNNISNKLSKKAFSLINMLNMVYEDFGEVIIDDYATASLANSLKNSYITLLKEPNINVNDILLSFPNLRDDNYAYDVFCYVMIGVLSFLQNEMLDSVDLMKQVEFYEDDYARNELEIFFYTTLNNFLILRSYYDSEVANYKENLEEISKDNLECDVVNNIYYLMADDKISYFEKDMIHNFPKEYLNKLQDLINRFKFDKMAKGEIKSLDSNLTINKPIELKDDQVRIVFNHICDNNYLIIGCDVKKSDNKRNFYEKMFRRIALITEEEKARILSNHVAQEQTELNIKEYINTNKRKGNR